MRLARMIVSHLTVILSLMFAVFLILDEFNPMMNFVDSAVSRWLLALLCLCGVCSGIAGWAAVHGGGHKSEKTDNP